ncbi:unnamed protein product [Ectocarpus fasciculatus]
MRERETGGGETAAAAALPSMLSPASSSLVTDGTIPGSRGSTTATAGTNPPGGDGSGQAGLSGPSPAITGAAWQPPPGVPSTAPPSSGPPQGTIPRAPLPAPLLPTTTPPRTPNTAASGGGIGVSSEPAALAGSAAAWEARSRSMEGLPDPLSLTGLTFEGVFSPSQERQKLAPLYNMSGGGDGTTTRSHSLSSPTTSTFSVGTLGVPSPTPSPSNLSALAGSNDTIGVATGNSIAMELDVLDAGSGGSAFGRSPGGGGTAAAAAAVTPSCSTAAGGEGSAASDAGGAANISDRDAKAAMYARFLRDPTGATDAGVGSSSVGGVGGGTQQAAAAAAAGSGLGVAASAAANAAMVVAARGAGAPVSPGVALDVVALGEHLSDEAKALAEEGLFDLVRDAWGGEASERARCYVEEEAVPSLPVDGRAFALAVEGRLEPGGEVETTYGKAAVEMLHLWLHLKSDNWVRWRETQDRRGAVDPSTATAAAAAAAAPDAAGSSSASAAAAAGGSDSRDVASAAAVTRGLGNNASGAPPPRRAGGGGGGPQPRPKEQRPPPAGAGLGLEGPRGRRVPSPGRTAGLPPSRRRGFLRGRRGRGRRARGGKGRRRGRL